MITVPSGGWDFALTVTAIGGPTTGTIAAGTYHLTDFLAAVDTALEAVFGGDGAWTVTVSDGETGTGLVTIAHATQTYSLTWTDTDARDALGFAGNLTPAALSFTGTKVAQQLWLPNAEAAFAYGNGDEGHTETDAASTESPRGDVKTLVYNSRQVLPYARWSHVQVAYARISGESVSNSSFERWWRNTQGGELSYFEPSSQIRLYWDAGVASYKTYRVASRRGTEMPRVDEGWNGLYTISLERLVRVPGT
jgi:hypothetical protein